MFRALIIGCLLTAAVARPAAAEWQITPLLGITFKGNTSLFDPENATGAAHTQVGVAVTFLTRGMIGAEAVVSLTPGFFEAKGRMTDDLGNALASAPALITASRTWALMGNAVLTAPRRYTEYGLRPLVSGGLGLLRAWEADPVINASASAARLQHRRRRDRILHRADGRALRSPVLRQRAPGSAGRDGARPEASPVYGPVGGPGVPHERRAVAGRARAPCGGR